MTPKILVFDVFGTVVDWHGGVMAEVTARYPQVDADAFALAWRDGYKPAMARVMSGELGWTRLDGLHRLMLEAILPRFGLQDMPEETRRALVMVWHRLKPWPDVLRGLARLKQRHIISPLSNGNISLLTDMAKAAGLPWDCVLSAEVFRAYKPDPRVYKGVVEMFDVAPAEVMLVAAHHDDLAAARACGLQTAYVQRPLEFGAAHVKDVSAVAGNTFHARDFEDLADQLAA